LLFIENELVDVSASLVPKLAPGALITIGKFIVTPLVVIACEPEVAANVKVPVYVGLTPPFTAVPDNDILPYTVMAVVPAQVTLPVAGPAMFISKHTAPVPMVTVYAEALLAASKTTLSVSMGTLAPLDPPDAVDQFVVELLSQVPVPPTQYLLAI
jgi:hypothetical protein